MSEPSVFSMDKIRILKDGPPETTLDIRVRFSQAQDVLKWRSMRPVGFLQNASGFNFKREDVVPFRPETIRPVISPVPIAAHHPHIYLKTFSVLHESFGYGPYPRRSLILTNRSISLLFSLFANIEWRIERVRLSFCSHSQDHELVLLSREGLAYREMVSSFRILDQATECAEFLEPFLDKLDLIPTMKLLLRLLDLLSPSKIEIHLMEEKGLDQEPLNFFLWREEFLPFLHNRIHHFVLKSWHHEVNSQYALRPMDVLNLLRNGVRFLHLPPGTFLLDMNPDLSTFCKEMDEMMEALFAQRFEYPVEGSYKVEMQFDCLASFPFSSPVNLDMWHEFATVKGKYHLFRCQLIWKAVYSNSSLTILL